MVYIALLCFNLGLVMALIPAAFSLIQPVLMKRGQKTIFLVSILSCLPRVLIRNILGLRRQLSPFHNRQLIMVLLILNAYALFNTAKMSLQPSLTAKLATYAFWIKDRRHSPGCISRRSQEQSAEKPRLRGWHNVIGYLYDLSLLSLDHEVSLCSPLQL